MRARHRSDRPDKDISGEVVSIDERLIVAPGWGRLYMEPLVAGQLIKEGAVVARQVEAGVEIPLRCHSEAVFLAWLVEEGERIPPGRRVACLRLVEPTLGTTGQGGARR